MGLRHVHASQRLEIPPFAGQVQRLAHHGVYLAACRVGAGNDQRLAALCIGELDIVVDDSLVPLSGAFELLHMFEMRKR
ncbi:hypothetical protein D3C71_1303980 [compost metagenome]